jgi:hypothetical protein
MNITTSLKNSLLGAIVGAAAITVIGFTWGGWVTSTSADIRIEESSEEAVTMALTSICVHQSTQDPNIEAVIAGMKAARSFQRGDFIMKAGWATMPGETEPNQRLARACVQEFADRF